MIKAVMCGLLLLHTASGFGFGAFGETTGFGGTPRFRRPLYELQRRYYVDEDLHSYYIIVDAARPVEPSLFGGQISRGGRRLHLSEDVSHDGRFSKPFRAEFNLPEDVDLGRISSAWSVTNRDTKRWLITLPKQAHRRSERGSARPSPRVQDTQKDRERRHRKKQESGPRHQHIQEQQFGGVTERQVPSTKLRKARGQTPLTKATHSLSDSTIEVEYIDEGLEVMDDEGVTEGTEGGAGSSSSSTGRSATAGALYGSESSGYWDRGKFHYY